jgi:hypothetical protein
MSIVPQPYSGNCLRIKDLGSSITYVVRSCGTPRGVSEFFVGRASVYMHAYEKINGHHKDLTQV